MFSFFDFKQLRTRRGEQKRKHEEIKENSKKCASDENTLRVD